MQIVILTLRTVYNLDFLPILYFKKNLNKKIFLKSVLYHLFNILKLTIIHSFHHVCHISDHLWINVHTLIVLFKFFPKKNFIMCTLHFVHGFYLIITHLFNSLLSHSSLLRIHILFSVIKHIWVHF